MSPQTVISSRSSTVTCTNDLFYSKSSVAFKIIWVANFLSSFFLSFYHSIIDSTHSGVISSVSLNEGPV